MFKKRKDEEPRRAGKVPNWGMKKAYLFENRILTTPFGYQMLFLVKSIGDPIVPLHGNPA